MERVFADAKEKHAMRYTPFRGLAQVTNWVRLKFAAMNLKKLARWLPKFPRTFALFIAFFSLIAQNPVLANAKTGFFYSLRAHPDIPDGR